MQQRKTRSLYGDLIRDALLHEQPWLKSEDLPEFKRFYVNNDLIEAIHNNGNHLIVGRRGTGKTHLLGSFVEF
jgi:DNA replication protein DnaC